MVFTPALLIALTCAYASSSPQRTTPDAVASVTFAVADVTVGSVSSLQDMTLKEAMESDHDYAGTSIVAESKTTTVSFTGAESTSTPTNYFTVPDPKCFDEEAGDSEYGINGLLKAAHLAYASHYGLTLSPDVIYVAILQGISSVVAQEPDKYRAKLGIAFEGKKTISLVSGLGSLAKKWETAILGFRGSIGKDIPDDLNRLLQVEFSTTTPLSTAVASLSVLDIYKHFYALQLSTSCGIPAITLEGTPGDWAQLQFNTIKLFEKLGYAGKWGKHLFPVLKEFGNAASHRANVTFWNSLYKYQGPSGSGDSEVTGWINVFYPYTFDMDWQENPCLDWAKCGRERNNAPKHFPRGTARVNVTWEEHPEKKISIIGGITGIEKDTKTNHLKPTLGWAVVESV